MASVRSTKNSTGIKPGDVSTFQITESAPFRGRVERIDVFASASSVVTLVNNAQQNALFPGSVNRFDPPTFIVPTGDVSTANDAVTVSAHGCVTGDPVKYIKTSNPIGGLANGVTYFLIRVDANTLRLATTAANARESSWGTYCPGMGSGSVKADVSQTGLEPAPLVPGEP